MKNQKIKYSVLLVSIVVFTMLCLIIKNNAPKEKAKTAYLNVLNWTSYIPDDVIADFEKEYNIKVNYGTYSSNEELLAKVSSAANGTYDLIFPSDYMIDLMIYRDMLEPLDSSRLSNFNNINDVFLHQEYDKDNKYSLPFLLATTVLLYDDEKVDHLSSYRDLLKPELKNNVILLDDQRIIIGALLNAEGFNANDTNDNHLEKAYEFYTELKPNIKAFDSDSPKSFFITGEVDVGLIWNAEAILAQDENPNLKISYPAEGFTLSMDNYAIVKNAKNVDAAYDFINFLLRDDICKRIIDEYPYISTNKNIKTVPDNELNEILSRGTYIENVGGDIKKYDKLWARIK
ncbi:spermidine/putrescine ABC transporter substrate-binding protein [Candidatus Saccharibacteria bacterium]|nr:spermidine/putrescine ABC transporter substrate-binding protein [Candidatus Saccharibacteria bacterium]